MQQHLMIHLVDQILTLGPLYLHSMFPYERYLVVLKSYVRSLGGFYYGRLYNRRSGRVLRRLRKNGKRIGLSIPLHKGRLSGRGRLC
jgi:hypothetical protein